MNGCTPLNTKGLTPLIDCDIIVYRVGFAANDPGEPIENCLHSVKLTIQKILDNFPDRADEKMYLTGKGNFREEIATIKKYKGNRDGVAKPQYYGEIREYLQKKGAEMIEGMEADDAMGIEQWSNTDKSTCIVTLDKDLKMIPGWHYNFVKEEMEYVPLSKANRFFWWQMLVGDPTDNIQGIKGIGPKKADKLLPEFQRGTGISWQQAVENEYKRFYGPTMWQSAYHEIAQLLWILREKDKTYKDYVL